MMRLEKIHPKWKKFSMGLDYRIRVIQNVE